MIKPITEALASNPDVIRQQAKARRSLAEGEGRIGTQARSQLYHEINRLAKRYKFLTGKDLEL